MNTTEKSEIIDDDHFAVKISSIKLAKLQCARRERNLEEREERKALRVNQANWPIFIHYFCHDIKRILTSVEFTTPSQLGSDDIHDP